MRQPTPLERIAQLEAESRVREAKLLDIQSSVRQAKAIVSAEITRFRAALDAERAKVVGLVALMEMVSADMKCYCFEDRETGEILGGLCHRCEVLAALRAAKEGTGPVQPDPRDAEISQLKRWVNVLRQLLKKGPVDRFGPALEKDLEDFKAALNDALSGEGTVPT